MARTSFGEPALRATGGHDGIDLELARGGDERAFARLVEPLQAEIRAHCYRMLGSIDEADDACQDCLVRAWRGLDRFEGRSSLRSWLYTIATRVCIDAAQARGRRFLPMDLGPASDHAVLDPTPALDIPWLSPFPGPEPGERVLQRESVHLAFVAALQHLTGNQRAALLLFDVLGFSAEEIAESLDTTSTSVNSALARARRVIAGHAARVSMSVPEGEADGVAGLADRFATAFERGDVDLFVSLLSEDVTWAMPPLPHWYHGKGPVAEFAANVPMGGCGSWRSAPTNANGQPAVALYLRAEPTGRYVPWSINVLTVQEGRIAAISSFLDPQLFARLGLPAAAPRP